MDPLRNPFAPGAGAPPPAFVGRDEIVLAAQIALHRIRQGRPEKSQILLGLRGVGKTVLLNKIEELAEHAGYITLMMEAPEGQRLAQYLAPALKSCLLKISRVNKARDLVVSALAALRGFASAFKVGIGEVEIEITTPLQADSGNLEIDLPALFLAVGKAAKGAETGVAILIDEIQYLEQDDLRALIVSMHSISQKGLPIVFFGAGLPQVAGLAGEAKSYAERLFDYPPVGKLKSENARSAIAQPIEDADVSISDDALDAIVALTGGYPYFIQEWGKHVWNQAASTPISANDVKLATAAALRALDQNFFRVRFDRLTPREQDYLRAMAEIGPGPHRSGLIAEQLGKKVEGVAPLRNGLIKKGMVWSPSHGDTAFTVPLFDEFMKRMMPQRGE
jgi:hypothetical protein